MSSTKKSLIILFPICSKEELNVYVIDTYITDSGYILGNDTIIERATRRVQLNISHRAKLLIKVTDT
jgi:hypothetical protein